MPRRVTIHAVFDGGHAAKVDAEGTGDPPAMAITNWLHGAALSVVRRVARWFDV